MAVRRFFKKQTPATKVVLSNGATVTFGTVDNLVGYFSTDNDYVIGEFLRCMSENRYAISEITEAEYNTYAQKKMQSGPSRPVYREEIGAGGKVTGRSLVEHLAPQDVARAVGSETPPVPAAEPVIAEAQPQPAPVEFRPKVGRRLRRA